MNFVIGMFTDLANMNRKFHNTVNDNEKTQGFNDKETAAIFCDLMSTIFGKQQLDLGEEMLSEAMIDRGTKPSYFVKSERLQKKMKEMS